MKVQGEGYWSQQKPEAALLGKKMFLIDQLKTLKVPKLSNYLDLTVIVLVVLSWYLFRKTFQQNLKVLNFESFLRN